MTKKLITGHTMTKKLITILALMGLVLAPAFAQGNGKGKGRWGNGGSGFDGGMESLLAGLPMEDLNNQEKKGLLHMREEEKLARGLYDADGKPYFGDTGW